MLNLFIEGVKYFFTLDEKTHVHIQPGNTKMGNIPYISLVPGGERQIIKNGGYVLTNVPGTCAGCCDTCECVCYAVRDFKKNQRSVAPSVCENTLLAMYDMPRFFTEIGDYFRYNIVAAFRIHEAGEFFNYEYFTAWIDFIRQHQETKFYTYTKRYSFVDRYITENGALPNNFVLSVSPFNNDYTNPHGLPEFIYDDGSNPELCEMRHCPAVRPDGTKTGVTCAMCRHCFTAKHGDKIAVYDHSKIRKGDTK